MGHRRVRGLLLVAAGACAPACASFPNIPPLYELETGLPGGVDQERYLFGLGQVTHLPDGERETVIRPFYLGQWNRKGHYNAQYLTPFVYRTEREDMLSTTVWPFLFDSSAGSETERERGESDDDVWVFPLIAWGDEPGQGAYFLLFPLGGKLKGKFLTDEMTLWAWPAYTHIEAGEWESTHVLWPIFASGSGGGREYFRIFPFWLADDTPTSSRRWLLWPLVHWATDERNDRTMDSWFAFPFFGETESRDGSFYQWSALYPFFHGSLDERSGDTHQAILWPVYRHFVRPGRDASTWYWPFWGEYVSESEESTFYAWPFVWDQWEVSGSGRRQTRQYVVPFWMRSETVEAEGAKRALALKSWPFFLWEEDEEGVSDLRIPSINPVFGWRAGDTVYGDLLQLVHWRADTAGRVAWDGPLGIVRYRDDPERGARLTLLWWLEIGLGGGEEE